MKTNFRRSVSAAVILTPAALLAACSSSDSWQSARSDNADSRYDYNGRSRTDMASSNRSYYTTSDGRTVYYDNRATGYDPYGDGVSGGSGTRVATLQDGRVYDTRTNDMNNPNWRDGPRRFDNDNPSQDNSSSQYNTGISRNQSPAEGTVNNQNIAKGTVRPENQMNQSQYQNQTQYQNQSQYQNQNGMARTDSNDARWQNDQRMAQNDPNWRSQDGRDGQLNNQNPSRDNSSSQYNTGVTRNSSPNEGTVNNQNIAKGTAQSGYRTADGRWVNDPQSNNQSWYSRQQAARNQSDPSTNPSNSNAQTGQQNWQGNQQPNQNWSNRDQNSNWNQNNSNQNWNQNNQQLPPREAMRDQNGNWIERNFNTTNMTTPDQQAAARQMSDPSTNPTNSNSQYTQNSNGAVQNNQDYASRTYPMQNSTATANSSNTTSNNTGSSTSSQQAARDISDPATNPSNGNAQIGQQNIGGVSQPGTVATNQPYSTRQGDVNAAGQPALYASNATPDSKILSLIHLKNQEEISLGQLAASNGSTAAVRDYGNMLVREHTAADAKVMTVASQTGTQLLSDSETKNMIRAEKAAMTKDHEKMADDSKVMKDPVDELRGLSGSDFDTAFAQKMAKGHQKLAAAIEKAQPQVRNDQTRQLLAELLPTVRHHEQMARQLPGFTETVSQR